MVVKGKDFVRGDVRKDDGLRLSREGSPGHLQQLALAEGQTFNTRGASGPSQLLSSLASQGSKGPGERDGCFGSWVFVQIYSNWQKCSPLKAKVLALPVTADEEALTWGVGVHIVDPVC